MSLWRLVVTGCAPAVGKRAGAALEKRAKCISFESTYESGASTKRLE